MGHVLIIKNKSLSHTQHEIILSRNKKTTGHTAATIVSHVKTLGTDKAASWWRLSQKRQLDGVKILTISWLSISHHSAPGMWMSVREDIPIYGVCELHFKTENIWFIVVAVRRNWRKQCTETCLYFRVLDWLPWK